MNQVPNMISTKDLSYIEDMMHWNFTDSKKAFHFANEISDEEIKQLANRIAIMHKQHITKLLDMLKIGG